jgi:hypothetical protein
VEPKTYQHPYILTILSTALVSVGYWIWEVLLPSQKLISSTKETEVYEFWVASNGVTYQIIFKILSVVLEFKHSDRCT